MKVRSLNSKIYIDKTEQIHYINSVVNSEQKYMAVSRPRRFGKSMAANMLCAYYGKNSDEKRVRELFDGKKLSDHDDWDRYLGKFNVVRLVMTDYVKKGATVSDGLEKMSRLVIRDIKKQYPDVDLYDDEDLIQVMNDLYAETGI